jgi:carbamate kinase
MINEARVQVALTKVAVVALGGNAFTLEGQSGTYEEQSANAAAMAACLVELLDEGWNLAIVHGNGPQVGNIAIQQEDGAGHVPAQPLFSLVAMTQGELGSLIALAVQSASGGRRRLVTLLAHVVVDAADPAFHHSTKPIGPFVNEAEARALAGRWEVEGAPARGYRRVVPSPEPKCIVEVEAVRCLLDAGYVVVTAGGGGIPVLRGADGRLVGVDAVVDKDHAAAALALAVGAQALVVVTAVDAVQVDFGTVNARRLGQISVAQAEEHLAAGQFPDGSKGPKVRAATRFLRAGGEVAVITSPTLAAASLRSADPDDLTVGTRIVNNGPGGGR